MCSVTVPARLAHWADETGITLAYNARVYGVCSQDYYNSPRMQDFLDVVKEGQEEHCIDKKQLTKQGARVYEEIQKRQLYDTIDLLVL